MVPGRTWKERLYTAVLSPYRLVRPLASIMLRTHRKVQDSGARPL
ncbi:hypothetical protein SALBM217S_02787 [Streptomyces griseoloalbus]